MLRGVPQMAGNLCAKKLTRSSVRLGWACGQVGYLAGQQGHDPPFPLGQPKSQFLWVFPLKTVGFPERIPPLSFLGRALKTGPGHWLSGSRVDKGVQRFYHSECRISPNAVFSQVPWHLLQMYLVSGSQSLFGSVPPEKKAPVVH